MMAILQHGYGTLDASDAVDCDPRYHSFCPPAIACAGSQVSSTISITNNESSTIYIKGSIQNR